MRARSLLGGSGRLSMVTPKGLSASSMAAAIAGGAPMRPPLAAALHSVFGEGGRRLDVADHDVHRRLLDGGDQIVGPERGRKLAGLVVAELLEERRADAVHRAAPDVPLQRHGIDHRAAVVDGGVVEEVHLAGLDIDLDHREYDSYGP